MRIAKPVLCLLAALMFGAAHAEVTGNDLFEWLRSNDTSERLRGYAYLEGVLDAEDFYLTIDVFSLIGSKGASTDRFRVAHICLGGGKVTYGQIKDVVFKYLESNPAKRHIRAHSLIRFALLEDFACAKNPLSSTTTK